MKKLTIALAGQPNSGKSTLFNLLTGAQQFIANYPGVTVEKKMGYINIDGEKAKIVDLPGTYSLTSYSLEETAARNYLLSGEVDIVLNIIDAVNLERGLNLTLQLKQLGLPLILILNMMDIVEKKQIEINTDKLAEKLDIPVVKAAAKKKRGKEKIISAAKDLYSRNNRNNADYKLIIYDQEVESAVKILAYFFSKEETYAAYSNRWLAVSLLAGEFNFESEKA